MNKKYLSILSLRKKVIDDWQQEFPSESPFKAFEITDVILILGSSRSGSSLLHHLIGQHPEIMSIQGEEVALSKLCGLNEIISIDDSDCISSKTLSQTNTLEEFRNEILLEAGYNNDLSTLHHRDICLRLILQWPEIEFKLEDLKNAAKLPEWTQVIGYLKNLGYPLALSVYDSSSKDSPKDLFEEKTFLIEEPPFIIPKAKSYRSTMEKKEKKILLLKSSVNAFRPELLLRIFPDAKFHFIHLTRNPAGAISGLIDGWLSHGFHTHNLSHLHQLNIDGYPSKKWWKFDLPPGWSDYVNQPLEKVCAFQWHSSNQAIFNFLSSKPAWRFRYEDYFLPEKVQSFLEEVFTSLSIDSTHAQKIKLDTPVMSIFPPSTYRWREKENKILPLLKKPELASLCAKLGYNINNLAEFK